MENKIGAANIILEEGESKKFIFENIETMDNFWCHSLNTVINFYEHNDNKDKNGYSRNFYSLFQIARTQSENILANTYQLAGAQWYMASGSHAFLNKLVAKVMEVENYHQFIYDFEKFKSEQSKKGNTIEKNHWITVIGDFIFQASIPKYIFEIVDKIYNEVNSISEYNAKQINNLFFEPGKTEFSISRNKKRADAIREEIKDLYKKYGKGY